MKEYLLVAAFLMLGGCIAITTEQVIALNNKSTHASKLTPVMMARCISANAEEHRFSILFRPLNDVGGIEMILKHGGGELPLVVVHIDPAPSGSLTTLWLTESIDNYLEAYRMRFVANC